MGAGEKQIGRDFGVGCNAIHNHGTMGFERQREENDLFSTERKEEQ